MDHTSSQHPLTPPPSAEEQLDWLRLLRSRRVGPATFFRLIDEHGTAAAALDALPELAKRSGVSRYQVCPEGIAAAELRAGRAAGARLLAVGSRDFPTALLDLPDLPPLLWVKGDTSLLARPAIALIGARNASSLGLRMARALGRELSDAGYVVTSGLARGIDAAAHGAALTGGTIAVMAGGVDVVYPAENADLADRIAECGLLVSEQPMGTQPQARHFPRRNRLVSGLSKAVVVVEAAIRSGTLITARMGLDQGREILAVPGHPFDARASGCNLLIRDGATLVRNAADVIEALGPAPSTAPAHATTPAHPSEPAPQAPEPAKSPRTRPAHGSSLQSAILDRLGPAPVSEDQLIRDLGVDAAALAAELTSLELDGLVDRQPGAMLTRT